MCAVLHYKFPAFLLLIAPDATHIDLHKQITGLLCCAGATSRPRCISLSSDTITPLWVSKLNCSLILVVDCTIIILPKVTYPVKSFFFHPSMSDNTFCRIDRTGRSSRSSHRSG